jgi:hypothetical protein
MYRSDLVVDCVDLSSATPLIVEKPVKRTFGQTDMYLDTTNPYQQQHGVEKMLSRLESRASDIFRSIGASSEKGHRGIWLTRNERDLIRKFLFLMKYRGLIFYRRYHHDTASDYDANDRERLLDYMREKGFEKPVDVWLHNIKVIIELEMDVELKWFIGAPAPHVHRRCLVGCHSLSVNVHGHLHPI